MLLLVLKPDYFVNSAARGLALFASSVLPALFPFYFCSLLLTQLGAAKALSVMGAKPVRVLFNCAPEGAYVLVLSMLSGYPVGAATVADLYASGVIDSENAKRICSFTSTSGPLFVMGTIGTAAFRSAAVGAVILVAHYLSALLTGITFNAFSKRNKTGTFALVTADTDNVLQNCIAKATASMLAVGGYVVIGNMLIDAIALSGLPALVSSALRSDVAGVVLSFLFGSVEMTRGSLQAASIGYLPLGAACACSAVSFGGLSVMLQSITFLSSCKIRFSALFARKTVQSAYGFVLTFLFTILFLQFLT